MSSYFKIFSSLLVALLISTNIFAAKITITMGGDDERAMREHYRYALDWAEKTVMKLDMFIGRQVQLIL